MENPHTQNSAPGAIMVMARNQSARVAVFVAATLAGFNVNAQGAEGAIKVAPMKNIVSTEKFATELCYVYISNTYGKEAAERQKPYIVTDRGEAWMIEGKLPKGWRGGVFEIVISKADGRVVKLTHSR